MWFKKLMGFEDTRYQDVKSNIVVKGKRIESLINGASYQFGKLEVVTLRELIDLAPSRESYNGKINVSQIVANVKDLHNDKDNEYAMFQAASQFNLLEMVGPHISPENGVDRYENDYTQGPACAISCGAGTIYRNYFAEVNGEIGQTRLNQIDCLDLIGKELRNEKLNLWNMRNGYALPSKAGILHINKIILGLTDLEREDIKSKLKVGIQSNTEVTTSENGHFVNQIYCSALPVSYSQLDPIYFEPFTRLILEATYEATFFAALRNMEKTSINKLFLTLVGGGAFGNQMDWIMDSIGIAISKFLNIPLDVKIVSFSNVNDRLNQMIKNIEF
jgi:hypothetical protein